MNLRWNGGQPKSPNEREGKGLGRKGACSSQLISQVLTGTGGQPSGKVVLVRGAGQAKETTSMESEQPDEDTQGCSGWSIGYR